MEKDKNSMKTYIYTDYGSPDVLQLKDVEKPTPKENEILVKVYAASANPLDWHLMRGAPFLARLENGLWHPKNGRLGADLAGRVEAVGAKVTDFKVGDAVYGSNPTNTLGAFGEYVCCPASIFAPKPESCSFEAAAAVPVAAFTALQGLRDAGKIQAGQKVLVNGASGGVGTFAVQIAKSYGAVVTGVCSTRNLQLVRSIGADDVIDYTQGDLSQSGRKFDLIYDAVGNLSIAQCQRLLTPNGTCVVAGFTVLWRLFLLLTIGSWVSRRGTQKIGMMNIASTNKADLLVFNKLIETGKVKPVIDRCYALNEVPEAIRYLETKHARGKVVITIASD
jgi:NADPH:quinone reductase-like Zn-dependent oxidoreductase